MLVLHILGNKLLEIHLWEDNSLGDREQNDPWNVLILVCDSWDMDIEGILAPRCFQTQVCGGVLQDHGGQRTSLKVLGDPLGVVIQLQAFNLKQFKTFPLFLHRSHDLSDEMNINAAYYNENETF